MNPDHLSGPVGRGVTRREDAALLTGAARGVADLHADGTLAARFVRSPVAHAVIAGIDVTEARSAPGVRAVFTAADLVLPDLVAFPPLPGEGSERLGRPCLARDRVRFVGEAVAVVLADTDAQAADAAELVEVSYDPLPAVTDPVASLDPGAAVLFPDYGTNLVLEETPGSGEPLDALGVEILTGPEAERCLTGAEVVVCARFLNQRLAPAPLEPGGALAVPAGDVRPLTVWASTQAPFRVRDALCAALGLPPDQVRVVAPAVGGGFGAKGGAYPEHLVVAAAAARTGRPVRWVESRSENLVAMTHGRAQVQYLQLGARRDGHLVGLRARQVTDSGAYPWRAGIPVRTARLMAAGVYRLPLVELHSQLVVTNTTPTGPYRGAGRPEAAALLERAMDLLAGELGIDPVQLRRMNLLERSDFPYRSPTGALYDSGDYHAALDRALEMAGYDRIRAEQQARRAAGDRRALGVGVSCFCEVSGTGSEYGAVSIGADGRAVVASGSSPHGQGHETTLAQIISGILHMPMAEVDVVHSDTARVDRGTGTFGSRSGQLAGSATARAAAEVIEKARVLAADLLEAAPADLTLDGGGWHVAGVPSRVVTWAETAREAERRGERLTADCDFAQPDGTYSFGAHVAVVEVDTETGAVRLDRLIAVDDCGVVANPIIVAGQVHGGLAQGVGQALLEAVTYDPEGNPLTTTLADYLVPSAADLPSWELGETVTPTDRNPLGMKGVGESGAVGSTVAVQNAVVDALSPWGVRHLDLPITPERVWRAVQAATKEETG